MGLDMSCLTRSASFPDTSLEGKDDEKMEKERNKTLVRSYVENDLPLGTFYEVI
jgi:hypothetical protein